MPFPGRLLVRLSSEKHSPFRMRRVATRLFRTISRFFNSDGVGILRPLPNAASTCLMLFTRLVTRRGPGRPYGPAPAKLLSRVKCFSITLAPRAAAAMATAIPGVWSE